MPFVRPANATALSKEEKVLLLKEYVSYYQQEVALDRSVLNRKVPREAFASLLDLIGELLIEESNRIAAQPGPVFDFLHATPLPASMDRLLPRNFRVYCLALNALKQWVSAEQAATDRFLLGGTAREVCRSASTNCIVTGESLGSDIELHHPVRDGRPPLPLSKRGHETIERQLSNIADDPVETLLVPIKRAGNRSWAMLRRGCRDFLGQPQAAGEKNATSNDRTFAKKAHETTQLSYTELLAWLDEKGR